MKIEFNKKTITDKIQAVIQKQSVELTQAMTRKAAYAFYGHVKELAQSQLHKRRQFYLNNLKIRQKDDKSYVIILRAPASWIENGLDAGNLREVMLQGKTHRVIPISDAPLQGTNKAKKQAAYSKISFRTMSINQAPNVWQRKALKGVKLLTETSAWLKSNLSTIIKSTPNSTNDGY